MRKAISAEFLRAASTRAWGLHVLAGLAVGLFLTGGLIVMGPDNMNPPMPGPDTVEGVRGLLGILVLSAPIPLLLGTQLMTREFEHRTSVPTFLAEPRRHRVVMAKLVVGVALGASYGLVLAGAATVGVFAGCAVAGFDPALGWRPVSLAALRMGGAMAMYTLVGVGIGSLIPRAKVCIGIAVLWFYLLESMLTAVPGAQNLYPWLPGGAASAIAGQSFVLDAISRTAGSGAVVLLPVWAGGLVLVGYAALAASSAMVTTLRRGIT